MADETTTNRKIGIIEANSDKLTNLNYFMDGNTKLESVDCNFQYVTHTMYAFRGCSALTSFKGKYPTVTKAEGMFNSSGLTAIQIGSDKDISLGSVTDIRNICENCKDLKSANISLDAVTHAESAFNGCEKINNVTINLPSVEQVDLMFKNCSTLSTIVVNFNNALGVNSLFDGCSNLNTATISLQSLNVINSSIFEGCNSLSTLTINAPKAKCNDEFTLPNSITTLNGNLNGLTSFALPSGVTTSTIDLASVTDGEKLVKNANNLKTVSGDWSKITTFGEKNVPYTLESFNVDISSLVNGNVMFSGCGSLNEVSFINGLPNLTTANRMFGDTISLGRIEENFPKLVSATLMFSGSNLNYVNSNFGNASDEESKVLVDGTKMFENCTELETNFYTNLASTLQIGDNAFDGAINLAALYTKPSSGVPDVIGGFAELKSAQYMFRDTSIEHLGSTEGRFRMPELRNAKGMFSKTVFEDGGDYMKYTQMYVPKLMCADEMFKNSNIYYFGTASESGSASTLISGHDGQYYITTALNMFNGCKELWAVYLNCFDISDLIVGNGMFSSCESLAYFCSHLTDLKAGVNMFHGCKLNKDSLDHIATTINNIYGLFEWTDDGERGECKYETDWSYKTWAIDITTGAPDINEATQTIDPSDRGMIHVDVDKDIVTQADFDTFSKKLADKGWKVESCSYKTEFSYDISHANHQYSSNVQKWKSERYEAFNLNITSIGWDEENQQGIMYGTVGNQEGNESTN